jgi:hypothetical protein
MNPDWKRLFVAFAGTGVVAAAVLGCGKLDPRSQIAANQPPVITLGRPSLESGHEESRLAVHWTARDPDGRVDHYLYAVDPPSVDRVDPNWILTRENGTVARFARHTAIGRSSSTDAKAPDRHVVAVRAVDDRGAVSMPVEVALVGDDIAPSVTIVSPPPSEVFTTITGTSVEIRWSGQDADGQIVKYKHRLFTEHNPDFPGIDNFVSFIIANPTFLTNIYAPVFGPSEKCPTCTSWDSVGPDVSSARFSGLTPGQLYLFAITAFDDQGAYDPVFSTSRNLLRFAATIDRGYVPLLCVSSPYFSFCQTDSAQTDLYYEIASQTTLPIQWVATPATGSSLDGYRWVLDPLNPNDELPRSNPNSDPNHWTPWSLGVTSATIGPFSVPADLRGEHVFYVQARDIFNRIATLRIHLTVVRPTFERALLIVDDTRLMPDQFNADGSLRPPSGSWPTAAELDTFLYARGGFPWRGYPAGSTSPTGLLSGYDFDTLGTGGIPGGIVPLSILSRYRHVIWLTDATGATYTSPPDNTLAPITSLRLMSSPGQYSTISGYVSQGGSLWIGGGGAAYATLADWNRRNTPVDDWTHQDLELVPGRFMYDDAHWQSCVAVRPGRQALINTPDFAPWDNAAMGRGWSGQGMDHTLNQPPYEKLIANPNMSVLRGRTCVSDPPPPLRACNSFYLLPSYSAEYIGRNPQFGSDPNFIREDTDPRPNHEDFASTLDTLYMAAGGSVPGVLPVMTYYHGFESGPVVFSGFPVWFFQKQQASKLVDFVLQDVWRLSRGAGPSILTTTPIARQKSTISATALNRKTAPATPLTRPR